MTDTATTDTVTVDVRAPAAEPALRLGLVHGLGSSTTVWDGLLALLPDTVETWTFRFPWDASRGSRWAWERDSRGWLDRALELTPGPPDVWLAHSFGANVLLDRLVRRGAVDARALILLSPFYRPRPEAFDWAAISHYFNDFDELVRAGILLRRGGDPPAPDLLEPMTAKIMERIGAYGWMRFFDLFTQTPFLDVSGIDVPCLVIGGGRDTAAYPDGCRSLAAALPSAVVEILPGSGHFPMVDDAPAVGALVGQFLREGATI